ncbi:arginine--tRNA ligase [Sinanaerobacter chloroacetimidivorans]|uniref:Arginine--tRNA ligase n=1 Tax=Sinanaerobacter chloroacetimidivorans TaxID=2818044 RepID=A0A8J7VYJ9_9FIRM|nr:arginine--tRNA ligase [Sinanaerobacter chloroacetimidivorans]MBR0597051.1 arginine--tRNA ligase [Sinanaerobacter chloroacetimidivorans]
MINFKEKIAALLAEAVEGLSAEEIKDMLEIPTDSKMGDYAFPCFKLAKALRKAPPIIAQDIAAKLKEQDLFERVENVNAYVNMFLSRKFFMKELLTAVTAEKENYGSSDVGKNRKVIVEFSSPNIAKPFHIGHIRSTVIGNSIYKIYDFLGYDTVRINHLGDYGTQFGKMIVAYRKWGREEDVTNEPIKTLLGYYVKFHEEAEKDSALEDEARAVFTRLENGEPEEVRLWQWFRDESLKEFNRVYKMLGIEFDSYAGESFYSDKMERIVNMLKEKNLMVESEGAQIVELEQYNMSPALIMKKDGSTLYITRDIAAAVYRKEHYDFYKNLYIVASQQNLHFQQWIKIIELLGYDWAQDCVHIPFGLVSLEEGTMSTRHGRVVFLEEVLNRAVNQTKEIIIEKNVNTDNIDETARQVGIGAVIFQELSNNRIKDYVFSWDKVLNFEGETGPYVQYTHARAASVLRNAGEIAEKALARASGANMDYVIGDSAYELAKLIYRFPEIVVDAAEKYEPSIVTRHIVDIAQSFNKFYHDEHILVDNEEEKTAKIILSFAAKQTIKNGLQLLGMEVPERM